MRRQAEGLDAPQINLSDSNPLTGRLGAGPDPLTVRLKMPLNVIGEENHLSNSNAGEIRMNSSLPNIDRPKNSTPIIDLDDVISHEGGGRAIEEDDDDEYE